MLSPGVYFGYCFNEFQPVNINIYNKNARTLLMNVRKTGTNGHFFETNRMHFLEILAKSINLVVSLITDIHEAY
jgi:hypothetical protein